MWAMLVAEAGCQGQDPDDQCTNTKRRRSTDDEKTSGPHDGGDVSVGLGGLRGRLPHVNAVAYSETRARDATSGNFYAGGGGSGLNSGSEPRNSGYRGYDGANQYAAQ